MLALVLALAAPAIAQVSNAVGQKTDSGSVNVKGSVESSGNYASQCVAPLQFANTANQQNGQAQLQYASAAKDLEPAGSQFNVFTGPGSGVNTTCNQAVQQSSAASSTN